MKIRLSFLCIVLALFACNYADAQLTHSLGDGIGGRAGFRQVSGDLLRQPGRPGRLWFETNLADQGLGYEGSYLSLGGKTRLFEDRLDGRWLFEGRLHHSLEEEGGFFGNFGIERVFSIPAANADVSTSFWYDVDADEQSGFAHTFHQVGITGAIKTRKWDLIGNGYLPTGIQDYSFGDPSGANPFVGNRLVLVPGIDSALQGFDVTLRMRPKQFAMANGTVDVGGYHYNSDLVDAFAGARFRLGFQILRGMMVNAEVNHDDRFDTTGVLGIGWVFGAHASAYGSEYSPLGRDLEESVRNDHIVRFNRAPVLAIDPRTGRAYNVIHADNTADGGIGDGTTETPFATLAEAEMGSTAGDLIFVREGDGTDRNYSDGITLKDNQLLLSGGGNLFLPVQGGQTVQLPRSFGGAATISNSGGNEVVRLAFNNFVGGLNIDGSGSQFGIFGQGITDGRIESNRISGATLDGVGLVAIKGNWDFTGNFVNNNGRDGVFINGVTDPNAMLNFTENVFSQNSVDGMHLRNYDGREVNFTSNITNDNNRNGLYIERQLNASGLGTDVNILSHIASGNDNEGIFVDGGDGTLRIFNTVATNNSASGLRIRNWTNSIAGDRTIIGASDGSTNTFTGNGTGLSIELDGAGLVQDILVTQVRSDGNGRGFLASSKGIGTVLNLDIIDNVGFLNNDTDGIRLLVDDSGVINNRIENTGLALNMTNNNINSGGTLTYVLGGASGQQTSVINSVVRNVNIDTADGLNKSGIFVQGSENSQINLDVADSTTQGSIGVNIQLDNANNNRVNRTYFDNMIIRGDGGFAGVSQAGTLWDVSVTNSDIQSNGILAGDEVLDIAAPENYTPYSDTFGDFGILILADGGGVPGSLFDNLTRVNIQGNTVRDFTFDGITLQTTGDAQMLATVEGNQVFNNGPGLDDDPDGDGVFEGPNSEIPNPNEFFFHDGLSVSAFGTSTISTRINNNNFLNNFERGVSLNTIGSGTINASMINNRLSNDIGLDDTPAPPGGADIFDLEVFNSADGNICLDMSNNSFRLNLDFTQIAPAGTPRIQVGLDGGTNGFTIADLTTANPGIIGPVGFGLCDDLITAEELFFQAAGGFPADNH